MQQALRINLLRTEHQDICASVNKLMGGRETGEACKVAIQKISILHFSRSEEGLSRPSSCANSNALPRHFTWEWRGGAKRAISSPQLPRCTFELASLPASKLGQQRKLKVAKRGGGGEEPLPIKDRA